MVSLPIGLAIIAILAGIRFVATRAFPHPDGGLTRTGENVYNGLGYLLYGFVGFGFLQFFFQIVKAVKGGQLNEFIDLMARMPLSGVGMFAAACTILRLDLYRPLLTTPVHKRDQLYVAGRVLNEGLDALVYAAIFVFLVIRPFGVQAFRIPSPSMVKTLLVNDYIVVNKAVYRYSDPKAKDIVVFRPPLGACDKEQIDEDSQPKVDFIKRCIGVPGDVIELRGGELFRNGKLEAEPYRFDDNSIAAHQDFKFVKYEGPYQPWKGKYIPVLSQAGSEPNYNINMAFDFQVGAVMPSQTEWTHPYSPQFKPFDELTQEEIDRIQYLKNAPAAALPPGYYLMLGDNRGGSYDGRGWGLVPRKDIVGRAEYIWLPLNRMGKPK